MSLIPLPKTNTEKQSNCQRFPAVKLQDKVIQDRAGEGAVGGMTLLKGWAQRAISSGTQPPPSPEVPANSVILSNTSWKCLKDEVLEKLQLQSKHPL